MIWNWGRVESTRLLRRVSVAEPAMYDLKLAFEPNISGAFGVSVAEPAMYDLKLIQNQHNRKDKEFQLLNQQCMIWNISLRRHSHSLQSVSVAEPAMYDLKQNFLMKRRLSSAVSVAEPAMYDLKLTAIRRTLTGSRVSVAEPAMYDLKL